MPKHLLLAPVESSVRVRVMKNSFKARLTKIYQKNADEILTFGLGRMPSFVTGATEVRGAPPVFCFHDVEAETFEAQLSKLVKGGYRTLDADSLERALIAEKGAATRDVALTFDDGTASFWNTVFPLLRRYECRAILFVIAGIVPNDDSLHPNLEDVWQGRASSADLEERERYQPVCTWRELGIMHESGLVDIQSHSMTHSRVPTSSRIIDFFFPGFPIETYGNVNIPLPAGDDFRQPLRALPMGAPIFESASRMAAIPRFLENGEPVRCLARHVEENGGEGFFARPSWRSELAKLWEGAGTDAAVEPGRYETREEMETNLRWELQQSKQRLEEKLPGKSATHFCYPWFQGSTTTDRLARSVGYSAVHYGLRIPVVARGESEAELPRRIQRLSEEYLARLPGPGRESLSKIALRRIRGSVGRVRRGR